MRSAILLAAALVALATAAPAQLVRTTATAGTTKPVIPGIFSEACGTNEVLVGIYGKARTLVDRIGGYCARVRADGTWDGELRATDSFGGSGGNTFDSKCARNEAIAAFSGRHGLYIDRIRIRCRALSSRVLLTGQGYYKDYIGGTGGTAFGPYTCPDNKAAMGFGGQTSLFVDALFLFCRV